MFSLANTISDGDKESECDEDGPSPEDSRKVNKSSSYVHKRMLQLFYYTFDFNRRK